MKSAGKARSNGLYRHIRTSKEIIRNLLNDFTNNKILRFYQWKNKIFEEAEVLLLLELHNGMLQMRAAHRAENSI